MKFNIDQQNTNSEQCVVDIDYDTGAEHCTLIIEFGVGGCMDIHVLPPNDPKATTIRDSMFSIKLDIDALVASLRDYGPDLSMRGH